MAVVASDQTAGPRPVAGLVERRRLFDMLDRGAEGPVTLVSAPAGSGKTMLLASWLAGAKLPGPVAWVGVERDETDPARFWSTVMDALRRSDAIAADDPLATLVPAPAGGQAEFLQRLHDGLGRLAGPVVLVLDDLHELHSDDALQTLDGLLARAPDQLRTIVISRRDPRLNLHRLRLDGQLCEVRSADLDFTVEEAGDLIAASGITVNAGDVARLHQRTEGWAAGLRLAAMSLARHDAPERFVDEFSGSERTVADYLLEEVLASQPPDVRKLLLRTCILERVNGELADLLTGSNDATRLLYELEEANAFVVAIDVARTWFRYHHLLADLLRLELRRSEPGEVARLHALAAGWFAEHGHVVESIRHAQLAEDWALATELVGRHGVQLVLDREEDTLGALLAAFPQEMVETDAELATITASGRLRASRWTEADALLSAAQSALAEVPEDRRRRAEVGLATVRLLRARRLGDLDTVVDDTRAVLTSDGDGGAPVAAALKALALMNLGIAEAWTLQLAEAEKDLQAGLAIGREIGSPLLEVGCLGGLGGVFNMSNRLDEGEDTLRQAIVIADRLGWTADPIVAASYMTLAALLVDRGMFEEAEQWVERADPILTHSPEPAATVGLRHVQAQIAFGRGDYNEALERLREGARLTELLRAPHFLGIIDRHWQLRTHLRLGDPDPARAALAEAGAAARDVALWCNLDAHVRLADGDAAGAAAAVAPVLAGEAFAVHVNFEIEAALLDAIARKQMSDSEATERSVERALELAEPQGRVFMVLTVPGAGPLLAAHPTHRTAYGAHLRTLLNHFAGTESISGTEERMEPTEPLTERELAVLRLLPTNLSAQDIGNELFVSVHTVKTHMRKLYAKLDVHTRAEAVQRARALGLLAPSLRR